MVATVYIVDAGMIVVSAWLLVRPPNWVIRYWAARRGTSRGYAASLVLAAVLTLATIGLVIALPPGISGAIRFQMLLPFVAIDLIAAAQYRATHRQPLA